MGNINLDWDTVIKLIQLLVVPAVIYLSRILGKIDASIVSLSNRVVELEKDYIRLSEQLKARQTQGTESHIEMIAAIGRVDAKIDKLEIRFEKLEGRYHEK